MEQLTFEFYKTTRLPPPDFSDCFQFDEDQRTAEAAAARKKISPLPLRSSYVADLNGYRVTQDMLRHPSGPSVSEIIKRGYKVRTNYGTGPYTIKSIHAHLDYGVQTYSIIGSGEHGNYYLNELVAVDGRILNLFLANDDEVFITDEPGQLSF